MADYSNCKWTTRAIEAELVAGAVQSTICAAPCSMQLTFHHTTHFTTWYNRTLINHLAVRRFGSIALLREKLVNRSSNGVTFFWLRSAAFWSISCEPCETKEITIKWWLHLCSDLAKNVAHFHLFECDYLIDVDFSKPLWHAHVLRLHPKYAATNFSSTFNRIILNVARPFHYFIELFFFFVFVASHFCYIFRPLSFAF